MENISEYTATINGNFCSVNENENMVNYLGEWYEIQIDQEGGPYIIAGKEIHYITVN